MVRTWPLGPFKNVSAFFQSVCEYGLGYVSNGSQTRILSIHLGNVQEGSWEEPHFGVGLAEGFLLFLACIALQRFGLTHCMLLSNGVCQGLHNQLLQTCIHGEQQI